MEQDSEVFIGLDTLKLKISVAAADGERNGEVRFFGDIWSGPGSVSSMVAAYQAMRGVAFMTAVMRLTERRSQQSI